MAGRALAGLGMPLAAYIGESAGWNATGAPVMECEIGSYGLPVFDRWGGLVCSSYDPAFLWDGDGAEDGIYQWMLEYTWHDGKGLRHAKMHGHVLLLR